MILIDTSVLIDYVRGKDAKLLALLPKHPVAVCGIVRAELLCGALNAGHRASLHALLATFNQVTIPDSLWDSVGDHLAELRRNGLTIPFADSVIVSLGIALGIEVWSRDKHFPAIQVVLPAFKLFQEPP